MEQAKAAIPAQPVWVAPNSLYRQMDIVPASSTGGQRRDVVLYIGRLEKAKKVDLAIRAFALLRRDGFDVSMVIGGTGSEREALEELAVTLGVRESVAFLGWVDDRLALLSEYGRAFCTVSPGFAGLGLTQSLGFGVPMVVAREEPHSPEIELASSGGVTWFKSDDPEDMRDALGSLWLLRESSGAAELSQYVARRYSAEQMAAGLGGALRGLGQNEVDNETR